MSWTSGLRNSNGISARYRVNDITIPCPLELHPCMHIQTDTFICLHIYTHWNARPRLSRDGANETNNMLAALDDISNLNLNNLAGSAQGLWDHARTFFLRWFSLSCVLPTVLDLSHFYLSNITPSLSQFLLFSIALSAPHVHVCFHDSRSLFFVLDSPYTKDSAKARNL